MIAVIVLLAWDLANVDPALESGLLWERLEDVLVAAGLVLIVTALFFPHITLSSLKEGLATHKDGLRSLRNHKGF